MTRKKKCPLLTLVLSLLFVFVFIPSFTDEVCRNQSASLISRPNKILTGRTRTAPGPSLRGETPGPTVFHSPSTLQTSTTSGTTTVTVSLDTVDGHCRDTVCRPVTLLSLVNKDLCVGVPRVFCYPLKLPHQTLHPQSETLHDHLFIHLTRIKLSSCFSRQGSLLNLISFI